MKIVKIESFILKVPLGSERFFSSQCAFPERSSLIVKIITDEGITGWGEGGQYGPPEPVKSCIDDILSKIVLGMDPHETNKIWETCYASIRDFGRKGPYIEAMSAIDIALWDILGKAYNKPVSTLLGGSFRNSIVAYATGGYYKGSDYLDIEKSISEIEAEAARFKDAGFECFKIKIGLLSVKDDMRRVHAIKKVLQDKVTVLVDCNHAYNAAVAIRIGKALEKYDIGWFEEPVLPEDINGYRKVRENVNLQIAGGECEFTRYGFKDLIINECVDIIQPDICVSGGFTEFLKILAFATTFNVQVVPHVWGSGIAFATAIQALSIIPPIPHTANPQVLQNEPMIEYDQSKNPLRDELLNNGFKLIKGRIKVPEKPGIGIDVNEDVIRKYSHV